MPLCRINEAITDIFVSQMIHKPTIKNMTLAKAYKQQFGKVTYPFQLYDDNGNITYHEASTGYWVKREYDSNGNQTYLENSYGYWKKRQYDANGKLTYYENSCGYTKGNKQSIEIDGVKYPADQVRERVAKLKPMADS